jgi:chitodextrinase
VYHDIARTNATTFTHTGLTPDTVYVYRVIASAASGSGQTVSDPSGYTFVTTRPVPDAAPPTKPGTPAVSSVSTVVAAVTATARLCVVICRLVGGHHS